MNAQISNRVFNPLMTLTCVAGIIVITAISIQLLYGCFQFAEMFIQDTSSQVSQYFSQLTKAIN
jgi:hypothetical protein